MTRAPVTTTPSASALRRLARVPVLLALMGGPLGCRSTTAVFPDAEGVPGDAEAGDTGLLDAASAVDASPVDAGVADAGGVGADAEPSPRDGGPGRDVGPGLDAIVGGTDATSPSELEPVAGDLVFVEVQGNPQGTADTEAEYLELLNVSGRTLDLFGCRLLHLVWTGTGMAPVRSVGNHLINAHVRVAPGERVLLTRGSGGYFGGAVRDEVYGAFELGNGSAENNRLRLMSPLWDGREPFAPSDLIDELIIPAATFDNPVRGRAWQLDPARVPTPTAEANDDPAAWCQTAATPALAYWMSNWGTPRAPNTCR